MSLISDIESWEVDILKCDMSALNEVYRDIAEHIGFEHTFIIYKLFRGTQISFPNQLLSKHYIHSIIADEYNGSNVKELAKKYNYSQRTIWRIIKNNKGM